MKDRPSVSVVVPCFNGLNYLGRTIRALLSQELVPDEIIVVDDASTDGSAEFAKKFGAPIRVVVSELNRGAAAARLMGVRESTADFIVFNDCGDVARPDRISSLVRALQQHPECVAAFASTWVTDQPEPVVSRFTGKAFDGSLLVIDDPLNMMLRRTFPLANGMNIAIRRDVALVAADLPPFYVAANDYALQIRAACHGTWVYVSRLTMECEILAGGLTATHGWSRQTSFALIAAVDAYEFARGSRRLNIGAFRARVEAGWPGAAFLAHLRGEYHLRNEVIRRGLKVGRLRKIPHGLWWALREADADGSLDQHPKIRRAVRCLAVLLEWRRRGRKDAPTG